MWDSEPYAITDMTVGKMSNKVEYALTRMDLQIAIAK